MTASGGAEIIQLIRACWLVFFPLVKSPHLIIHARFGPRVKGDERFMVHLAQLFFYFLV